MISSHTKVYTLYVHFAELLVAIAAGPIKSKQSVFDVTMTPILALDLGDRSNIAGTESEGRACVEHKDDQDDEKKSGGGAQVEESHAGQKDPQKSRGGK